MNNEGQYIMATTERAAVNNAFSVSLKKTGKKALARSREPPVSKAILRHSTACHYTNPCCRAFSQVVVVDSRSIMYQGQPLSCEDFLTLRPDEWLKQTIVDRRLSALHHLNASLTDPSSKRVRRCVTASFNAVSCSLVWQRVPPLVLRYCFCPRILAISSSGSRPRRTRPTRQR